SSAVYVTYGAITPQLASKTGFSDEDAEKIKLALQSLFEGDASAARPEGSMEVLHVIWCKHNSSCGQYSSANVHRAIKAAIDEKTGMVDKDKIIKALPSLKPEPELLGPLEGDKLAALPRREK
ncbi:MAG: type I CRISPR-associated protein Cas7, partial [Victivallales bacterium]|nr:type I CRISPR-associated protein Cas7 [Victivallales bacterium]